MSVLAVAVLLSFLVLAPVFAESEPWEESLLAQKQDSTELSKKIYWRWTDPGVDHWVCYNKLTHFVGFSWQYLFVKELDIFKDNEVLYGACLSAILWEVKDAVCPWEIYGLWGGDGFSYKDLIWSLAGVGVSYLIRR